MSSPIRLDGSAISVPDWYESWDKLAFWLIWLPILTPPFIMVFTAWLMFFAPFWLVRWAVRRVQSWRA